MTEARDYEHMARALRLARRALYDTDPNPAVGCVIVQDGSIVGEGWTAPPGGPHAERVALAAAGDAARGSDVYVTLEPCAHHGRTGPCTDALIEAGVATVHYAITDPNRHVAGNGAGKLAAAGIAVCAGPLGAEATAMNRGYLARTSRGRPWVRSKIAASLDGGTALENGASQWITGPAARADAHRWRARSSAVMTGVGTILADDPSLTARPSGIAQRLEQPVRVVLDSRLRTSPDARVLGEGGQVYIFTTRAAARQAEALTAAGARIETVAGDSRCDLDQVLRRLAALEVNDVWVEAGAELNGALLGAGLIDELVLYLAPRLMGDRARGLFSLEALERMDEVIDLVIDEVRTVGADLRVRARPRTVPDP
jgi:diaminohydroxyphosphoribosylaminopyrimidine deaminase/5-amino-6-(5-phosphoribosylamino)uracil reductase